MAAHVLIIAIVDCTTVVEESVGRSGLDKILILDETRVQLAHVRIFSQFLAKPPHPNLELSHSPRI